MIGTTVRVLVPGGNSTIVGMINSAAAAAQPTVGDLLYAGQRQRTRILDRTARGVDVDGQSFAAYSSNGPYYYYPSKNARNRQAGAARFAKKLGIGRYNTIKNQRAGILGRTRLGIKFSSYAAFKSALGRAFVDLRGPSAPHMLQAIIVKVKGFVLAGAGIEGGFTPLDVGNSEPADEIIIGIYGQEAERAEGHNEGKGHLPRRHFLGASELDKYEMLSDILKRATARVRKAIGGRQ